MMFVCVSLHRFTETKTRREEEGAKPDRLEQKLHPEASLLLLLDVSGRDDF